MKSISWPTFSLCSAGVCIAFVLALASCAKETGSTEPQGTKVSPETKIAQSPKPDDKPDDKINDKAMDRVLDPTQGTAKVQEALGEAGALGDASYGIKLDVPDGVAKGSEAVVRVVVTPKTGWKMNKEFPTKLQITAPAGVALAKGAQGIADAERFEDKGATFAVKFQADSPGQKSFQASFKFAVCTDATCDPKKQELAWVVNVQ